MMQGNVPRIMKFEVHLLYKVYKKYFWMSKFTKILFCLSFCCFIRYTKIGLILAFHMLVVFGKRIWGCFSALLA